MFGWSALYRLRDGLFFAAAFVTVLYMTVAVRPPMRADERLAAQGAETLIGEAAVRSRAPSERLASAEPLDRLP